MAMISDRRGLSEPDLVQPRDDLLQSRKDLACTKQTAVCTNNIWKERTLAIVLVVQTLHAVPLYAVLCNAVLSCAALCLCLASSSGLPADSL